MTTVPKEWTSKPSSSQKSTPNSSDTRLISGSGPVRKCHDGWRRPDPRVVGERALLVVLGIDDDREEHQVAAETIGEALLKLPEVAGQPEAIRRVRAAEVGEGHGDDLAGELREGDRLPALVGEHEVRHGLSTASGFGAPAGDARPFSNFSRRSSSGSCSRFSNPRTRMFSARDAARVDHVHELDGRPGFRPFSIAAVRTENGIAMASMKPGTFSVETTIVLRRRIHLQHDTPHRVTFFGAAVAGAGEHEHEDDQRSIHVSRPPGRKGPGLPVWLLPLKLLPPGSAPDRARLV